MFPCAQPTQNCLTQYISAREAGPIKLFYNLIPNSRTSTTSSFQTVSVFRLTTHVHHLLEKDINDYVIW